MLYICEKPDQARKIAAALGGDRESQGFIRTPKGPVTWAVGHLVNLANPDHYNPDYKIWRIEDLPIIPVEFKYIPREEEYQRKQLDAIKTLLSENREVAICSDAGREGEMIVRELLDLFRWRGSIKRLWVSALNESTLIKGLANLLDGKCKEPLYNAALARSQADWISGLNLTRAFSCAIRSGTWSLGRVQTPTLALVYDREMDIQGFRKSDYYEIQATFKTEAGHEVELTHKADPPLTDKAKAEGMRKALPGTTCALEVKEELRQRAPPALFSLNDLQRECNAKYKWPVSKTLKIAQDLYEAKMTTYPRVDSQYLTDEQYDEAKDVLKALRILGTPFDKVSIAEPSKRWYDTRKTSDHHAIIPTGTDIRMDALDDDARRMFLLIAERFVQGLMPNHEYKLKTITAKIGDAEYKTAGKTPTKMGWRDFTARQSTEEDEENPTLPDIKDGERAKAESAKLDIKTTKAPPHFTEGTLIAAMQNIARYVEDKEVASTLRRTQGIGTSATRPAIIDTLKTRGYMELNGDTIRLCPKGKSLIETARDMELAIADPAMTAEMEEKLEAIAETGKGMDELLDAISKQVETDVSLIRTKIKGMASDALKESSGRKAAEPTGKCPACGGDVYDKGDNYVCANRKYDKEKRKTEGCDFSLWKTNNSIKGKLGIRAVKSLLAGKEVVLTFIAKDKKEYEGIYKLERVDIPGGGQKWGLKRYGLAQTQAKK